MRERFLKIQKKLESPETNTEMVYSPTSTTTVPTPPASLLPSTRCRQPLSRRGRCDVTNAARMGADGCELLGFQPASCCTLRLIETAADEAIKTWRDRWRSSKWDWRLQAARCFKGKETLAGDSTTKVICLLLIFIRFSLSHVLGFKCLFEKIQSINKIRFRRFLCFVLNWISLLN